MLPIPPDVFNPDRLAVLDRLHVLDTPAEPLFDDVVRLARRLVATPIALISLVDEQRQWFKASSGLPAKETTLDKSVCAHGLTAPGLLVIPDLTLDPRTRSNPMVMGAPHLRFYAGAPLRVEGQTLGMLCAIDLAPRPAGLTLDQAEELRLLAGHVVGLLDMRRLAQGHGVAGIRGRLPPAADRVAAAAPSDRRANEGRLLTLLELGDRLRDIDTSEAAVEAGSAALLEQLGAGRAGYAGVDPEAQRFDIRSDLRSGDIGTIVSFHATDRFPATMALIRAGKTFAVDDVASHPDMEPDAPALAEAGVRALINIPLMQGDQPVGVLFVHCAEPRTWTADDQIFAEAVADRVYATLVKITAEEQRRELARELQHRLKNTLAVVSAMVSQTLREVEARDAVHALQQRIAAFGRAHDVLLRQHWSVAPIRPVIEGVLGLVIEMARVELSGPDMLLGPQSTLALSMLLHELGTNALKYGALSAEAGVVRLSWAVVAEGSQPPRFALSWAEVGGPPVGPPARRGFGSRLLHRGLPGQGSTALQFEPDGLVARFDAPLAIMTDH